MSQGSEEPASRSRLEKLVGLDRDYPPAFVAETRAILLARTRLATVLAVILVAVFIPVDYVRMPEHFHFAWIARLTGCLLGGSLFLWLRHPSAKRHVFALTLLGTLILSVTTMSVAAFAKVSTDPVFLVQSISVIFLIMGAGLLFPLNGRAMAVLGCIPLGVQAVVGMRFPVVENLAALLSSFSALAIACVGAESAFATRLGEFRGRQSRADFIAMLSHDIRNPLGAILGFAGLAREEADISADLLDMLKRIDAAAHKALMLAANFLDVSRIEQGILTLRRSPSDVGDLLRNVVQQQATVAALKGIELEVELGETLPRLDVDPVQIDRVLSNLVDNAIKFSACGGVVRIRARRSGGNVEIAVEDEGMGLPPGSAGALFHRYSPGTVRSDSTGLGLFIVKTIIEAHGGSVSAENREDRSGARFTVRLPAMTIADEPVESRIH